MCVSVSRLTLPVRRTHPEVLGREWDLKDVPVVQPSRVTPSGSPSGPAEEYSDVDVKTV